ncbi:hypothetical protein [Enterococcus gallinarum]|uniref:hypothetical protein n=1 Tax=Enterococcus gallinarum TaxID=1353 RepID=UPI001E4D3D76|nr:hypothetical protein [Enterococcus gallinarum]MCD5077640.1 hypothetical protein [Enterococcus gallinarum]
MGNTSDKVRPESVLYFEEIIRKHDKVRLLEKIDEYLYCLTLYNSKKYKVYITNLYTVGIADVIELSQTYDINAIVTMSSWNSYTLEAKKYGQDIGIGVFIFKELMGAINFDRPAQYFSGYDEHGNKVYEGARG